MVVDLKDYLTEDEKAAFVPGYITEGDFDGSGSIKIFPVAKSTELMFFNDTDWQRFAKETFVRYGALSTMEGVTAVAEQYYNWSGGKALFGRDALANYMLVGAKQLGCEIFEVHNGKMTLHFDRDVVRKLWDNYYVPFVKGYFAANGRFRSDDVKTGALLGCVGSCASATFFPKQVMPGDNQVHDIEMKVLPAPRFAGSEKVAVQQGAGMVVTTGTEAEINGAVTFLKWFTEPQNNIAFAVESGYLPVTTAANDMDAIRASGLELTDNMEQTLSGAVKTVRENELYTPTAFAGGNAVRKILEYSMGDQASADRDTVLERIAAGQSAGVALRSENVVEMKKNGKVVLLTASPETIYERVKDSNDRPLLKENKSVEFIAQLMEKRKEKYEDAADVVIRTDGKTILQICEELITRLMELEEK